MSTSAAAVPPLGASADAAELGRARFARFAWGSLAYTILVVLFGAVVRITGSGAGCGQHWPTCQGEVTHLPQSVETAIELTHRLTSGLSLVLVVVLFALALRRFERGHLARRAAGLSLVFMITEALIGAALVLLALVGENDSAARAVVMAAHLVNTSLLTAAMALTAWAVTNPAPVSWRPRGVAAVLAVGLFGMLLVSMTGAVTALGDTLYPIDPSRPLSERMGGAHFLQQLRIVHPLSAVAVSALLLWAAPRVAALRPSSASEWLSRSAVVLIVVQLGAGVVNVLLSAPGWMQIVHLLLATLVWLTLVLLLTSALPAKA